MSSYKILIIPAMIPFPPDDGGKLCIYGFIDKLRSEHQFDLFLQILSPAQKSLVEKFRNDWPEVTIHTVDDFSTPPPESFVKKAVRKIYHKFFKKFEANTNLYESSGVTLPFEPYSQKYIDALQQLLQQKQFDIIQTEHTTAINLVNIFPPAAKKVFVELESRHQVLYDYGKSKNFTESYIRHVTENVKQLEYSFMERYDGVIVLNEESYHAYSRDLKQAQVFFSPFGILDKQVREPLPPPAIPDIVFVGSENHTPNADALQWFAAEVLPKIPAQLFGQFYFTGKWSAATVNKIQALHPKVQYAGFVADIEAFISNKISVVPIRLGGGGIRAKILVAMASGSPVVSTTLGCVGIQGENGKELLITDTADAMAAALDNVLSNKQLYTTLQQNAAHLIRNKYSQSVVSATRNEVYHQLMTDK